MLKNVNEALKRFNEKIITRKNYTESNDNVLIVDGTNYFIRNWVTNPQKNENGDLIGGAIGFLRSLGNLSSIVKPTRIVICFDGRGGSQKRKSKYANYKSGRSYNNNLGYPNFNGLTEDYVRENRIFQIEELSRYLALLPVKVIILDEIEADDVIAYLSLNEFKNNVIIASSDNDYLQLIDDRINVYSPQNKFIMDRYSFKEKYGFESRNFIWMKCILGDSSDNVKNIKGIGKKGFEVLNEFLNLKIYDKPSEFLEGLRIYLDNNSNIDKIKLNKINKIYNLIKENFEIFKINYEIMQLFDIDISGRNKITVLEMVREPIRKLKMSEIRMALYRYKDNFNFNGIDEWYRINFSSLIG